MSKLLHHRGWFPAMAFVLASGSALGQDVTPAQLADRIIAVRSEIRDVEFSYLTDAVDAPHEALHRDEGAVIVAGSKFSLDRYYAGGNGLGAEERASFDDTRTYPETFLSCVDISVHGNDTHG